MNLVYAVAPALPSQTVPPRRKSVRWPAGFSFLLALALLGSLASCQRAPYAHLTPTYHPAAQRLPVDASPTRPAAEPLLTASLANDPAPVAQSRWVMPNVPVAEPTVAQTASQSQSRQRPQRIRPVKPTPPACDQIVLRNGDVIEAKVKEVGVNEIRYKKCDRPDGPDYTMSKQDVLSIKYSTGEVERFGNTGQAPSYNNNNGNRSSGRAYDSPTNSSARNDGPRTDPFAIVAIATGSLAVLTGYGAFLLGAVAIVFGALSLTRIRREPGRFKGRGLAIGGMVAGLVSAALILLYILL